MEAQHCIPNTDSGWEHHCFSHEETSTRSKPSLPRRCPILEPFLQTTLPMCHIFLQKSKQTCLLHCLVCHAAWEILDHQTWWNFSPTPPNYSTGISVEEIGETETKKEIKYNLLLFGEESWILSWGSAGLSLTPSLASKTTFSCHVLILGIPCQGTLTCISHEATPWSQRKCGCLTLPFISLEYWEIGSTFKPHFPHV